MSTFKQTSPRTSVEGPPHAAPGAVVKLPRQFTLWSLLAFAIAVSSAWMATSSLLPTHLMFGGPAAAFWIPVVSGVASMIIALGLAELSSAYPSSGGQYHYAFMIAPVKYRQMASFATAWFTIFEWLFVVCSTTIYPAQLTTQLASIWFPSYTPERWHIWLVYVLLLVMGTAVVIFFHKAMPRIEVFFCWSSLLAFITFVVTLLAASHSKQRAADVFLEWQNASGWPDGFSFIMDVGQGMWIYVCMDAATHLAEEIYQPEIHVPRALILSTALAIFCNVVFTLAALFSVTSIDAVSSSFLPIYEVTKQAVGSDGAVLFLLIWLDFTFISTVPGALLTTGRLVWAFSRDGGLPYSPFFDHISSEYQVPVEATVASGIFCFFFGLIYIGSTVAFNTFTNSAIVFAFLSYSLPQLFVFISGRDTMPQRYFNLGKTFGTFVNIFSVAWIVLYIVLFCFPLSIPTSAMGMNYVSVVFVASMIFIGGLWWGAGKRTSFVGPQIGCEVLHGVNAGTAASDPATDALSEVATDAA
ncbi:hypothetical protein SEUCBS140593_006326 [Sporothrix eucalyptigena]|uniref:Choline transport protein n=1 Tax=Sporothrix eucalyptigena TaxID=1812306 RepID=A0ABP0C642_9PEZI